MAGFFIYKSWAFTIYKSWAFTNYTSQIGMAFVPLFHKSLNINRLGGQGWHKCLIVNELRKKQKKLKNNLTYPNL